MNYSVLMSVYYKEKPNQLQEAIESIMNQTQKTDDFVLVCDGPLGEELNTVVDYAKKYFQEKMSVVRLEKNIGLGNALNIGLAKCKNEFVARMDSDDISIPTRCEKQLNCILKNDVDIVGSIVNEFQGDINNIISQRIVPKWNDEIIKFAKKRNPFNHPSVMYKKTSVERAGGYKDFYLLEDYYLWLRMIVKGCKGYNIQEPLLYMRVNEDFYNRRSGIKYAKSQKNLFRYMYNSKFIGWINYITEVCIRMVAACIPNRLRRFCYKIFMR